MKSTYRFHKLNKPVNPLNAITTLLFYISRANHHKFGG